VINDYESREAALAGLAVPQVEEFLQSDPFEQYASAPPTSAAYVVVSRVVR
jgi:hypothetical protein